MPLIDSPPDALAKVYATSLFELAEADGGRERLEGLAGELEEVLELTRENPQLSEFLSSKILATADREASLTRMFQGRISPLLLHFLLILNRKERLAQLLPIAAAYDQMVQDRFGRIEIDIYTRHELQPDQISKLTAALHEVLKREPVIYTYTDPAMIGGIRMQVGDKLIDASVATQLRKMRERLMRDGAAVLRGRLDHIFDET